MMKKLVIATLITAALLPAAGRAQSRQLNNSADSVSYVFGQLIGMIMETPDLREMNDLLDIEVFIEAFRDKIEGRESLIDFEEGTDYFETTLREYSEQKNAHYKVEFQQWMEDNGRKPGIITTESGLQYRVIREADGPKAGYYDDLQIKYLLTSIDGTEVERSGDDETDLEEVSPYYLPDGLTEGLQLMSVGAEYEFYVPEDLGFGARGQGEHIKPYAPFIFRVELISIDEDDDDDSYYDYDEDVIAVADYQEDTQDDTLESEIKNYRAGHYSEDDITVSNMMVAQEYYTSAVRYADRYYIFNSESIDVMDTDGKLLQTIALPTELKDFDVSVYHRDGSPRFMVLDSAVEWGYPYGALLYSLEDDGTLTELGYLNVSPVSSSESGYRGHYDFVNQTLMIYDRPDGTHFTFGSGDIIINPKGREARIPGPDLWYVYDGKQLIMDGPGKEISYFKRERLVEMIETRYGTDEDDIVFADLNNDGYKDVYFKREEDGALCAILCRNFEPVEFLERDMTGYNYTVYDYSENNTINIYLTDEDDESYLKSYVIRDGRIVEED